MPREITSFTQSSTAGKWKTNNLNASTSDIGVHPVSPMSCHHDSGNSWFLCDWMSHSTVDCLGLVELRGEREYRTT